MSSSLARDIPEDLLDMINELIIYENKYRKNDTENFQYEYAYDYVDSVRVEIDKVDKDPTIIKILLQE